MFRGWSRRWSLRVGILRVDSNSVDGEVGWM